MATKHRFGTDRGLSARMLTTMLLLFGLYAVVVAVLLIEHVKWELVLVVALIVISVQYFGSAKIAMYSMRAKIVTPEQAPRLHAVIDRLCVLANMPKPKLAIADTDVPNASVSLSIASCRRERAECAAACSAASRSALILFCLNTSTARAISPISS